MIRESSIKRWKWMGLSAKLIVGVWLERGAKTDSGFEKVMHVLQNVVFNVLNHLLLQMLNYFSDAVKGPNEVNLNVTTEDNPNCEDFQSICLFYWGIQLATPTVERGTLF
ncbi:hypothetical protein CEXT_770401 [Caerostris extrusa]|uniref:Uncharacterized protein n=1 Tax=Caerostris extrusa TaxID=172846 RepID=A0AAV4R8Z0_CAEEX|nr:hypothetical protein CEXT_770401 [Caerostris extrusa]